VVIDGRIQVGDRGLFDCNAGRLSGPMQADRADVRLTSSILNGRLTMRSGTLTIDAVRIQSSDAPAVLLDHVRGTIVDLLIAASGPGLEVRASELIDLRGLTITGAGPSIVWDGQRPATWRWERFALDSPPRNLPGQLPAGPGMDLARLPTLH